MGVDLVEVIKVLQAFGVDQELSRYAFFFGQNVVEVPVVMLAAI